MSTPFQWLGDSDSDSDTEPRVPQTVYSGIMKKDIRMSDETNRDHTLAALFEACDERVGEIVPDFGGDRNMDHVDVGVGTRIVFCAFALGNTDVLLQRLVKAALFIFAEESGTNTGVTLNKELVRFGALLCDVYVNRGKFPVLCTFLACL
jgi:hypothetical protein